ncbi:MAG: hypothetical protein MJ070_11045 [Lachnospiraceae bacterium]|nr:hypothetical protein [Lachnospiraceae bacterium]
MKRFTKAAFFVILILTVTLLSSCSLWERITAIETEPPRTETEAPDTDTEAPDTDAETAAPVTKAPETEAENAPETADPSADDFVIEDGVLVQYKGQGGVIILPDEVREIPDDVFTKSGTAGSILTIRLGKGVEKIGEGAFSELYLMSKVDVGSNQNFFFEDGILGRKDGTQFFFFDGAVFDRDTYATITRHYEGRVSDTIPSEIVFRRGIVRGEFFMGDFCAESVSAYGNEVELSDITPMGFGTAVFDFDDWTYRGFVYSYRYTSGIAGDTYVVTEDGVYEFHNGGYCRDDNFLERVLSFDRSSNGSLTYTTTARRYLEGGDNSYYTGNEDYYRETGLVSFKDGEMILEEPEKKEDASVLFTKQDAALKKKAEDNRKKHFDYLVTSGEYLWDCEYDEFKVNGTVLLSYIGEGGKVVIPDFIVEVADDAFSSEECADITRLTLGKKTEVIGGKAFTGLTGPTVFVGNDFYSAKGSLLYNETMTYLFLAGAIDENAADEMNELNELFDGEKMRLALNTPFSVLTLSSNGEKVWINALTAGKVNRNFSLSGEQAVLNEDLRCVPASGLIYLSSASEPGTVRLISGTGVKTYRCDDEIDDFNFMDLVYEFTLEKDGTLTYTASRRYLSLLSDPVLFFRYANDAALPVTYSGEVSADEEGLIFTVDTEEEADFDAWSEAYAENEAEIWAALGEEAPEDGTVADLLARNSEEYQAVIKAAKQPS